MARRRKRTAKTDGSQKNDAVKTLLRRYPHVLGNRLGFTKLGPIHSDWIKYIWDAPKDRSLQAFRGSYKTTAIVIVGIIWSLLYEPEKRILLCREETKNARKVLRTIRSMYKTKVMRGLYAAFWNMENFEFQRESDFSITLPTKRRHTPEGNVEIIGIDGSLTGGHYDHIHTDDIITVKDRISQAKRDQVERFIYELDNVIDPKGVKTHSGTPWHKQDGWTLLPKPLRFPAGTVEGDEFTREYFAGKKASMPRSLWAANYELSHVASDRALFANPKYAPFPKDMKVIGHIDAGYRGKDTTAITFMAKNGAKVYAKGWVWDDNIEKHWDDIKHLHTEYKCGTIHVEYNTDKGNAFKELRKRKIPTQNYHEKENKHIKILSYLFKHFDNVYWDDETDSRYMAQIVDYVEGQEPDDAPDSAAALLRIIMGKGDLKSAISFYSQT